MLNINYDRAVIANLGILADLIWRAARVPKFHQKSFLPQIPTRTYFYWHLNDLQSYRARCMRSGVRSVQFASSDSGGNSVLHINVSSYRTRHEPNDNLTVLFPFNFLIKKYFGDNES